MQALSICLKYRKYCDNNANYLCMKGMLHYSLVEEVAGTINFKPAMSLDI